LPYPGKYGSPTPGAPGEKITEPPTLALADVIATDINVTATEKMATQYRTGARMARTLAIDQALCLPATAAGPDHAP